MQKSFRLNTRTAVRVLMTIYLFMTLAETAALVAAGMNVFDALIHSFATIATGGFSSKNASIAFYNSVWIEVIIMVFMILSGINFAVLFSTFVERRPSLWRSTVVRYYLAALAAGTVLAAISTRGTVFGSWPEALRYSAFQILSVGTSTGFATADSSVWPVMAQILLMIFALQCACAGSTSGGIKADRIVLFGKAVMKQLKMMQHPRAVIHATMDGLTVGEDALLGAVLYIGIYLIVVLAGGLILILLGTDAVSAFSGTIAATGNVGPGLGSVGSTSNFAGIPEAGKWVLTANMLLGRLEIYGLLMLFLPGVLRRSRSAP
jgi:trk system potassium uptake protein TrkH